MRCGGDENYLYVRRAAAREIQAWEEGFATCGASFCNIDIDIDIDVDVDVDVVIDIDIWHHRHV